MGIHIEYSMHWFWLLLVPVYIAGFFLARHYAWQDKNAMDWNTELPPMILLVFFAAPVTVPCYIGWYLLTLGVPR